MLKLTKKQTDAIAVVLKPLTTVEAGDDCRLVKELIIFAVRGSWEDGDDFLAAAKRQKRFARAFGLPPLPPIDPAVIAMIVQMITAMMANKPV
jgi:hypothetical protein